MAQFEEKQLIPKRIKQIPSAREVSEGAGSEIREARNSPLYWWYECLRASDEYQLCCKQGGKGALAGMFQDFGNVFEGSFAQWWIKHGRKIFAERKPLKKVRQILNRRELEELAIRDDRLVIEIPLTLRKQTVMRQIGKILKTAYEDRQIDIWRQSTARRQVIKSKVRMSTVEILLKVLRLRNEYPQLTNYEIGTRAGIDLDIMARDTTGDYISIGLERRRMTIAVSRYLKQAKNLIANAEKGIFPSLQ